jgi:hypothetical protein
MDKELVKGELGDKAKYAVSFKDGHLVAELDADLGAVTGGVVVKVSADSVIDAIEKKIPGQLDDAILELVRKALKA